MNALALLFAGYSIFCAISIALAHFSSDQYRDQPQSRAMGLVLLLALSSLQTAHFAWLYLDRAWVDSVLYRTTLFAVAPSFFLFSRPLLKPNDEATPRFPKWAHFLPVAIGPLLPAQVARPVAFIVGAGYLLWLGRSLLQLRRERERFSAEMSLLGSAFIVAVGVAVLGLVPPVLPDKLFTALYASAIGLAFLLVQTTLSLRPQLPVEVREAAQATYVNTTLAKVDCDAALAQLQALMASERLFIDAELSLAALAAKLGLSAHQLSELLNTRLGKSFARYIRELRIDAAKTMLCDEPSASVLSVGLSVGFTSQSNFYEAFREVEGTTPGQYRKLHPRQAALR